MSLTLHVDRDDDRPIYLQIASQIKDQISVGKLPPGTRLPSVRHMANQLEVNRLTVHNAYAELQADGWVESTVGRGTYVVERAQPLTLLSSVGSHVSADGVLTDIYPISQIPTLRSLAYSEPDPSLAPIDEFWGMLTLLRRDAASMLTYDSPQGDSTLRVALTGLLNERGVDAMPDEIMVTAGAMQALSLLAQVLARPGDAVLVESPTYLGMVHILKTYGLRPINVPMDDEGPDLSVIERAMRHDRPRFFYTVPTFHNPTGLCMSETRRRDLLELAASYKLPIIEDDIYGPLALDGPAPLTLRSMDRDGMVIYVGSASKVLMPGLRVGWMVASSELQRELILRRLAIDLFGPPFVQRALALFIQQGRLKAHLKRVLPVFRSRRDALLKALRRHMPEGVTWTHPIGGFSTWATLPADIMTSVYHGALQRGVAFTPGTAFLADSTSDRYMRLCYSTQPVEELDGIVALLAGVIRERLANPIEAEDIGQLWTAMA